VTVAHADPAGLYAAAPAAGVYASTSGGADWIQGPIRTRHHRRIWGSPHDPQVAYTPAERTDDGGATWRGPDAGRHGPLTETRVYRIAWDAGHPATLFAATGRGLHRSTDDGRTWTTLSIDDLELARTRPWALATARAQPGVVAVGAGDRVAVSTDTGDSWTVTALDHPRVTDHPVRGLAFLDPTDPAVAVAVAGGPVLGVRADTVTDLTPDLPGLVSPRTGRPLVIDADHRRLYWVAGRGSPGSPARTWWADRRLYAYDGTTETVTTIATPEPVSTVATHPTDPQGLYVGGDTWVYESRDGGDTWTALATGFHDRYLATVGTGADRLIVGSAGGTGVSVSRDGGQTFSWARSGVGPWHQGAFAEHHVMTVATRGDRAYATTAAGLLVSADGGRSWTLVDTDFSGQGGRTGPNTHLHGLAVHPTDPATVIVGTGRGGVGNGDAFQGARLWRSTDGGGSWERATALFPTGADTTIRALVYNPHDPTHVYCGTAATSRLATTPGEGVGLWASYDGGRRWRDIQTPNDDIHAVTVDAADPDTLYIATPGGVYRSTSAGDPWTEVLASRATTVAAHPTTPGVVFTATERFESYWDLLVSTDAGDTWDSAGLTIQAGREPGTRAYDAREPHHDSSGGPGGEPLSFAFRANTLYVATNGVGLWTLDTTPLLD